MSKRNRMGIGFLCVMGTSLMPEWLEWQLGISPLVSVSVMGFVAGLWAFAAYLKTEREFVLRRAAIEAKYEAEMAEIVHDAAQRRIAI